jgi:hypothetical protein
MEPGLLDLSSSPSPLCPTASTLKNSAPKPAAALTGVASSKEEGPRPFIFAEFFAGMGGFTLTIDVLCAELVRTLAPKDGYGGHWDILQDQGFEESKLICAEADHGHFAPPCRTLTRARREDKHGKATVMRSDARPEGWGNPAADEANNIVERMVVLCMLLCKRGATFAIENPWDSFIWLLKSMQKLLKLKDVQLVLLHQCPYGAVTQKATGILTNAQWMKSVCLRCQDVQPHYHLKGGLVGWAWDYVGELWVWRTSLAAEYPCGLCQAWANALSQWLLSSPGKAWIKARSFVKVGKFGNTLIRAGLLSTPTALAQSPSKAQVREKENAEVVGGLRDPRRAVARSAGLRAVGARIRKALTATITAAVVYSFETNLKQGINEQVVYRARLALCKEFGADVVEGQYQHALMQAMLVAAGDPDALLLPGWLKDGFPLGIAAEIKNTGIFPATDKVSANIAASKANGKLVEDWAGDAQNYLSFEEVGAKAQAELDRLVQDARADVVDTWEQVVQMVGLEAKLTKLACLVKIKDDGSEKIRLLVDMRRSGVNGMMTLLERVVLPRISDVASSLSELLKVAEEEAAPEFLIADFVDAFYTLKLLEAERKYVVCKGLDGRYYIMRCVCFGLACGPLLWGRLAAAAMRLAQSAVLNSEGRAQCYVDDPIIIAAGKSKQERSTIFIRYVLLWMALGFGVAWQKAARGTSVTWIGVQLDLTGAFFRDLVVSMTESKKKKLLESFAAIRQHKGMVPLKLLVNAAGVLGWISNVIPLARPWTAMLWAVVHQAHTPPALDSTRVRKGLTFVKQIAHAIGWLECMLSVTSDQFQCLRRVYRWRPGLPTVAVRTDASPFGMGGILLVSGKPQRYWACALSAEDLARFGAQVGDPAFQSEWELLAVHMALRIFGPYLNGGWMQVIVQADNTSALQAALQFKAKSPLMNFLAAEVSLELEAQGLEMLWGQHIPGADNTWADALSRLAKGKVVPEALRQCYCEQVPVRDESYFRAWPEV